MMDLAIQDLADHLVSIINDDNGDKPGRLDKLFKSYGTYLKSEVSDPLRGPRDEPDDKKLSERLLEAVNAMVIANPSLNPHTAARWLLHSSHGRELLSTTKKENPMPRIDELKVIAKTEGGMDSILEHIAKGNTTYTEHELTAAGMEYAGKFFQNKAAGESIPHAFARYVESTPAFCKALDIVKGYH
jgi:hypothetical protein